MCFQWLLSYARASYNRWFFGCCSTVCTICQTFCRKCGIVIWKKLRTFEMHPAFGIMRLQFNRGRSTGSYLKDRYRYTVCLLSFIQRSECKCSVMYWTKNFSIHAHNNPLVVRNENKPCACKCLVVYVVGVIKIS